MTICLLYLETIHHSWNINILLYSILLSETTFIAMYRQLNYSIWKKMQTCAEHFWENNGFVNGIVFELILENFLWFGVPLNQVSSQRYWILLHLYWRSANSQIEHGRDFRGYQSEGEFLRACKNFKKEESQNQNHKNFRIIKSGLQKHRNYYRKNYHNKKNTSLWTSNFNDSRTLLVYGLWSLII